MNDIHVRGTIVSNDYKEVYDFYGMESTCPNDVKRVLDAAKGGKVDVFISSGGGYISAGSDIYEMLRTYKGDCMIHIQGLAASAASMIACSRNCEMSPTALFMVHNVSGQAAGDNRTMIKAAEVLTVANQAIAAAYTRKTGMSEAEILDIMATETWLTAEKAVEYGFVDRVSKQAEQGGVTSLAASTVPILPETAIARYRSQSAFDEKTLKAISKFTKLGGNL